MKMNMTIIFTILVLTSISISAFAVNPLSAKQVDQEWTMFRHDLARSGYSSAAAPNTNNLLWSYSTGGAIDSSPAVADGKVYLGSNDGNVYCFGSEDGLASGGGSFYPDSESTFLEEKPVLDFQHNLQLVFRMANCSSITKMQTLTLRVQVLIG